MANVAGFGLTVTAPQSISGGGGGRDFIDLVHTVTGDCSITGFSMITVTGAPQVKLKVFRLSGVDFEFIAQSELFNGLSSGQNDLVLATPISAQAGDLVCLYVAAGSDAVRSNNSGSSGDVYFSSTDFQAGTLARSSTTAFDKYPVMQVNGVLDSGGNTAPTSDAGVDQTGIVAGSIVTLDASNSSDADGDTLTYQWTQTSGQTVTLSDVTAQSPSFTAPSEAFPQTLTFSLTVNDGTTDSLLDTVDVGVLDNGQAVGYDVILLIGQSNMVGRTGPIDPIIDATDSRIKQYGSDRRVLELAENPLDHLDEGAGTVGPGISLAKYYADNVLASGRQVLLVPAARGGSGFNTGFWRSGGAGYNNAIARANEAIALGVNSRIVMMAWHQGESDSAFSESQYAADLDALISGFRGAITGASDCPFIIGEISSASSQYGAGVAAALLDTPNRVSNAAFVTTNDLALSGDSLHFTAASSRTMGERYAAAYITLVNTSSITISIGAPDGDYHTVLTQGDIGNVTVVYDGTLTFTNGAATISGLPLNSNHLLRGFIDTEYTIESQGGAIKGVTV